MPTPRPDRFLFRRGFRRRLRSAERDGLSHGESVAEQQGEHVRTSPLLRRSESVKTTKEIIRTAERHLL
jgi:hypothetical protein